ncbi:FAD:protein FMN transferase [Ectothiorhodospiraceae bacterium 2226]|nr:FAD:protein FMN transferase [Ectothiorhodospiraceae bacterium 2226]
MALLLALALAGCTRDAPLQHAQFFVLGTLVEVTLYDVDAAAADQAFAALSTELQHLHRTWHAWEPGPLTELNAGLARGERVVADPDLLPLLRSGREWALRSGELFNPAIGGLVALWGFHAEEPAERRVPPTDAAIDDWLAEAPGMRDLIIEGDSVRSTHPRLQLDFGAFAKGVAVDRAVARLQALGIEHAIVNAGGDLRAIGRPGDRPWRIGIRHPRAETVLAAIEVSGDESVFTSGDYERTFSHEGRLYHHILDPRRGRPAEGVASVTVVAPQGALADAAATALFVAGFEGWPAVARALDIDQVMLVDPEGRVAITPALAARIQFEFDPPALQVVPLDDTR